MKILMFTDLNTIEQEEFAFRRMALKNAVICIGWLRLLSVIYYVILYFLVHANSKGHMSNVIQIMILVVMIPQVLEGIMLFMGALEEKVIVLELSLWLCLIVASYNTVLGMLGGIYYIRTGYLTMHFLLAVIFGLLALSLYTVICHDVIIIYAFKKMLKTPVAIEM